MAAEPAVVGRVVAQQDLLYVSPHGEWRSTEPRPLCQHHMAVEPRTGATVLGVDVLREDDDVDVALGETRLDGHC